MSFFDSVYKIVESRTLDASDLLRVIPLYKQLHALKRPESVDFTEIISRLRIPPDHNGQLSSQDLHHLEWSLGTGHLTMVTFGRSPDPCFQLNDQGQWEIISSLDSNHYDSMESVLRHVNQNETIRRLVQGQGTKPKVDTGLHSDELHEKALKLMQEDSIARSKTVRDSIFASEDEGELPKTPIILNTGPAYLNVGVNQENQDNATGESKPSPITITDGKDDKKKHKDFRFKFTYNDLEQTPVCAVEYQVIAGDLVIEGKLDNKGCGQVSLPEDATANIVLGNPEADNEQEIEGLYKELEDAINQMAKEAAQQAEETQKQKPKPEFTDIFEQEVNEYLDDLKAESAAFKQLPFYEKAWELSSSAATGVGDGITDYIPDLGEIGDLMDRADIGLETLVNAIATGDVDEMERKFQEWSKRADAGLEEAAESMEMLILILKDEKSRKILAEFPARYIEAVPPPVMIEMAASQGTQWGIDTAAVSGSTAIGSAGGGVGGPMLGAVAVLAVTGRRSGKAAEAVVNVVDKLGPALKEAANKAVVDLKPELHHKIDPKRDDKSKGDEDKPEEDGTYKCDWEGCQGGHKKKIKYPKDGLVEHSKDYDKKWVEKGLEPWVLLGESKKLAFREEDYLNDYKKTPKNVSEAKAAFALANDGHPQYKTQKHHIIPVSLFPKYESIEHNAVLIGYDVNSHKNGVCLPTYSADMLRHNLQRHKGRHSNKLYFLKIKNRLDIIEESCEGYCKNDKNGNLSPQRMLIKNLNKESEIIEKKLRMLPWEMFLQNDSQVRFEKMKALHEKRLAEELETTDS